MQNDLHWVAPFGNLRIKACVPLPEAYRSLLRPSSSDVAKAFTNGCNWFMQTSFLSGVYFSPLQLLTLNFQRTKMWFFRLGHPSYRVSPILLIKMVGPDGLEPSTPRLSSVCSNQLSYEPEVEDVATMVMINS